MQVSRKRLAIALGATALLALVLFLRRANALNRWPIVNCPPPDATIICLGDSLVAGVGADSTVEIYPAQLGTRLGCRVKASGVPGETAAGGLLRLQRTRGIADCVVVVTLGGNDLLGHTPWQDTERSLESFFLDLQARGCMVVYTGVSRKHPTLSSTTTPRRAHAAWRDRRPRTNARSRGTKAARPPATRRAPPRPRRPAPGPRNAPA